MDSVNIRPGISILSALKLLNYKPHFALAEFIDNSLDSFLKKKQELLAHHGNDYELKINIDFIRDDGKIIIRDNAAGISKHDYSRAFKTAEIPPDLSGLSEFGMGMKSAACWFSNKWTVVTKSIDEDIERTINFDIDKIIEDKIEELDIVERQVYGSSYTTIILSDLHNSIPTGSRLGKIKNHLTSIYRDFIRYGDLKLYYNGELLLFEEPKILIAPTYDSRNNPHGETREWKQMIDFPVDENLHVSGMIGILDKGSNSKAGLSLFRRRRVIVGTAENKYKPEVIFGKGNSFASQRIFGELHLTGFQVTHTKDGFKEGENMELFLEHLREQIDEESPSLLKQAQNYRKVPSTDEQSKKYAKLLNATINDLASGLQNGIEESHKIHKQEDYPHEITKSKDSNYEELLLSFENQDWLVCVELSYEHGIIEWLEVGDNFIKHDTKSKTTKKIGIRLNMKHPFMLSYGILKRESMPAIIRLAAVIGLAEVLSKNSGVKYMKTYRTILNLLLLNIT